MLASYYGGVGTRSRNVLVGTGTSSIDGPALQAAINASANKVLEIRGTVALATSDIITSTQPLAIVGSDNDAIIKVGRNEGNASIRFGNTTNYAAATGTALNATIAEGESFFYNGSGLTLARGDWVYIRGDNALTGMTPHGGGTQYPGEVKQILEVDGNDICHIEGLFCDSYTSNVRIQKMTMTDGFTFDDIRWQTSALATACVHFYNVVNARVINNTFEQVNAGGIRLQAGAKCLFAGNTFAGSTNYDNQEDRSISFLLTDATNTTIENNAHYGGGPLCDVAGMPYLSGRAGTPNNINIKGNTITCSSTGLQAVAMHPEGRYINVTGNVIDRGSVGDSYTLDNNELAGATLIEAASHNYTNSQVVHIQQNDDTWHRSSIKTPISAGVNFTLNTALASNANAGKRVVNVRTAHAFHIRCRDVTVSNNIIRANNSDGNGSALIVVAANGCVIQNNTFKGRGYGVRLHGEGHGCDIIGNTFELVTGDSIRCEAVINNLNIQGNRINSRINITSSGNPNYLTGTGINIQGNSIRGDRSISTKSIMLKDYASGTNGLNIIYNDMRGWGSGSLGIENDPGGFQTKYASYNRIDD